MLRKGAHLSLPTWLTLSFLEWAEAPAQMVGAPPLGFSHSYLTFLQH